MMFDYKSATETMDIPIDILAKLESEARLEFPDDTMMMELHVLRAIHAYTSACTGKAEPTN